MDDCPVCELADGRRPRPGGRIFRTDSWLFEHGVGPAWDTVATPDALHALKVTLILTAIAVPANTIFGVLCALAIVRHRYPGAGIVNAVVDLPLALSPVVVGLALLVLYGRGGWLGGHGIVFALPGMVRSARPPSRPSDA